eukprot:6187044-Pleurochrysis_carterae.AAC.2
MRRRSPAAYALHDPCSEGTQEAYTATCRCAAEARMFVCASAGGVERGSGKRTYRIAIHSTNVRSRVAPWR